MDGISLVVIAALLVFSWCMWGERKKSQQELEQLKRAFTILQMDFQGKDSELTGVMNDYNQYQEKTSKALSVVSSELQRVADMFLPPIENVKGLLARMSAESIAKNDLPFSREFQQTMTQLVAQKGEAITRLNETGLRLSLGVRYLMMVGAINPRSVEYFGEHLQHMETVIQAQTPYVDTPGFKETYILGIAASMNRVKKALLNGDEAPSAEDIALWTKAFDALRASAPEIKVSKEESESEATGSPDVKSPSFSTNGHSSNGRKEGVAEHE